jgi:hypothetical protein
MGSEVHFSCLLFGSTEKGSTFALSERNCLPADGKKGGALLRNIPYTSGGFNKVLKGGKQGGLA